MPNGTIEALKQAIAGLEQDLTRHREALRLLEGRGPNKSASGGPKPNRPPAWRASAAARGSSATKRKSAQPSAAARKTRPRKGAKGRASQPSATQLIRDVLSNQSSALTPAEIVKALAARGQPISADNVHRRLSDMTKAKAVTRSGGKYTIGK